MKLNSPKFIDDDSIINSAWDSIGISVGRNTLRSSIRFLVVDSGMIFVRNSSVNDFVKNYK